MGVSIPRVSLSVDTAKENALGEIGLFSLGYGLHEAWVFASNFSAETIFGVPTLSVAGVQTNVTVCLLASLFVYAVFLILAGLGSKWSRRLYGQRAVLVAGAVLMCVGTGLLLVPGCGIRLQLASGLLTGVGSGIFLLFWGRLFSHLDGGSIILNSALSLVIACIVYTLVLCNVEALGVVTGVACVLLPAAEFAAYHVLGSIMQHRPLTVDLLEHDRESSFLLKFCVSVFLFGLALGAVRAESLAFIVHATSQLSHVLLIGIGCTAAVMVFFVGFLNTRDQRSTRFFKLLVPVVAVAILWLPYVGEAAVSLGKIYLMFAFVCFEAVTWIYFSMHAQGRSISPMRIFGLGRGFLALGSGLFVLCSFVPAEVAAALPYAESLATILLLVVLFTAFAILPEEPIVMVAEAEVVEPCCESCPAATRIVEEMKEAAAPAPSPATTNPALQRIGEAMAVSDEFTHRCEVIASTYLLSARETEVLVYLARGFNSSYIQEKLYISEGTAKTHTRHIYQKLDIHSQQELMRIVEEAC